MEKVDFEGFFFVVVCLLFSFIELDLVFIAPSKPLFDRHIDGNLLNLELCCRNVFVVVVVAVVAVGMFHSSLPAGRAVAI